MADNTNYFKSALSNFATEVACGGAVRHLTDAGFSLDQMIDRLDYPTPRAKVQKLMMARLYETHVLLKEEPSLALFEPKQVYVQDQDAFGRRSMRKTSVDLFSQKSMTDMPNMTTMTESDKMGRLKWRENIYTQHSGIKLTNVLHQKCEENGEKYSYVSCEFSYLNQCQGGLAEIETLQSLNNRQKEYLLGIDWELPVIYHRLNQRMREVIVKLYDAGQYSGACYFLSTGEKLILNPR